MRSTQEATRERGRGLGRNGQADLIRERRRREEAEAGLDLIDQPSPRKHATSKASMMMPPTATRRQPCPGAQHARVRIISRRTVPLPSRLRKSRSSSSGARSRVARQPAAGLQGGLQQHREGHRRRRSRRSTRRRAGRRTRRSPAPRAAGRRARRRRRDPAHEVIRRPRQPRRRAGRAVEDAEHGRRTPPRAAPGAGR